MADLISSIKKRFHKQDAKTPESKKIHLTIMVQDSGKVYADSFSPDQTDQDLLDYVEAQDGLPDKRENLEFVNFRGKQLPISLADAGIQTGTIMLLCCKIRFPKKQSSSAELEEFQKAYPLRFVLPNQKIVFLTCHGFDRANDVINCLKGQGLLSQRGFYRISGWESGTLSRVDPAENTEFPIIEQPELFATLYGCPTAELSQKEALLHCHVEVIDYV